MKALMFSNDPNILVDGTEAQRRMQRYALRCEELHIVVLTTALCQKRRIGNLFCYPASSRHGLIRRLRAWLVARRLCKTASFALISVQAPDELGLAGYLVSRRFHVPLQLQMHTDMFSPWYRKGSALARMRYLIARFLLSRVQCLRVVSERIKRSIVEARIGSQASKITVLPIYTEAAKFLTAEAHPETEARFRGYDLRMIAAGRFVEKEKNFLLLIEAMRELVRTHPRTLLTIVGAGPARAKYESRIADYALAHNVLLEPWRDDLPSFYKSFDLFLLSSNYEGWGRVVIEAMAAGLCVVMTDVGLAGEVVHSGVNGLVVPVGDRAALVEAIEELHDNEGKRKHLAEAGRETVERLALRTEAEYLALYERALRTCIIT